LVGKGAFGEVELAMDRLSGAYVAIKHIKGVFLRNTRAKNVLRELSILRQVPIFLSHHHYRCR
jgi:serine/threonine protein kinase